MTATQVVPEFSATPSVTTLPETQEPQNYAQADASIYTALPIQEAVAPVITQKKPVTLASMKQQNAPKPAAYVQ